MPYEKYKRFWAVTDAAGRLVCLAVYRKGAEEVLRRLGLAAMAAETKGSAPRMRRRKRRRGERE